MYAGNDQKSEGCSKEGYGSDLAVRGKAVETSRETEKWTGRTPGQ